MRNKRGIEKVIIFLFIALIVLVLMGTLFIGPAKNTVIPFLKNLPNFNLTKSLAEDMGLFRYRLADQTVQYYTGTEWRNFDVYEFNKKRAENKLLYEDFRKFYFASRKDKAIDIYVPENGKYVTKHVRVDGVFSGPLKQGKIIFTNYVSINGDAQGQGGEYIYNGDGKIYKGTYKGEEGMEYSLVSDATEAGNVKAPVVAWLNGILTSAAKFRYYDISDKKNPKLKANYFNVTRVDNDLIVDLNKPVGVEENGVLEAVTPTPAPVAAAPEKEYGFLETICFLRNVEDAGVSEEEVAAQAAAIGTAAGAPKVGEIVDYLNSAPTALPADGTVVESVKVVSEATGPQMAKEAVGVIKNIGEDSYVVSSKSGEIIGKIGEGMNIEKITDEAAFALRKSDFKVAQTAIGKGIDTALKLADNVQYVKTVAGKIVGVLEEGTLVKYLGVMKFVSKNSVVFRYGSKFVGRAAIVYGLTCDVYTIGRTINLGIQASKAENAAAQNTERTDELYKSLSDRISQRISDIEVKITNLKKNYASVQDDAELAKTNVKASLDNIEIILNQAKSENEKLKSLFNLDYGNTEYDASTGSRISDREDKELFNQYNLIVRQLENLKIEIEKLQTCLSDFGLAYGEGENVEIPTSCAEIRPLVVVPAGAKPDLTLQAGSSGEMNIYFKGALTNFFIMHQVSADSVMAQANGHTPTKEEIKKVTSLSDYKTAETGDFVFMRQAISWGHPLAKIEYIFTPPSARNIPKIGFVDDNKKAHLDKSAFDEAISYYSDNDKTSANEVFNNLDGAFVSGVDIYSMKTLFSQPLLSSGDIKIIELKTD